MPNLYCTKFKSHIFEFSLPHTADILRQDYILVTLNRDLESAISRVCASFGANDDIVGEVLEDLEFYQISLTTPEENAVVDPALSLANVFIRDNDGRLQSYSFNLLVYT